MRITALKYLANIMTPSSGNLTQNDGSRLVDHQPNIATVIRAKNNRMAFFQRGLLKRKSFLRLALTRHFTVSPGC